MRCIYPSMRLGLFVVLSLSCFHISVDIKLEDLEDHFEMKNQWLIQFPFRGFIVSAASHEEKQAWIKQIKENKTQIPQSSGRMPTLTWNPEPHCMRCFRKFTVTQRRHHCRNCGRMVCSCCSEKRAVLGYIHPTKVQRVCPDCYKSLTDNEERNRLSGSSTVTLSLPILTSSPRTYNYRTLKLV